MKDKNSIIAVFLLFLLALCLTGLEFLKDVELSYKKPLIDLYGNESPVESGGFTEEPDDEKGEGIPETIEKGEEVKAQERKAFYTVNVRSKKVTFNGRECGIDELSGLLSREVKRDSEVILRDDYAEYFTYLEVRDILFKAKENKGFGITEKIAGE